MLLFTLCTLSQYNVCWIKASCGQKIIHRCSQLCRTDSRVNAATNEPDILLNTLRNDFHILWHLYIGLTEAELTKVAAAPLSSSPYELSA